MGISYLISLNLPILPCAALGILTVRSPLYCIFIVKSQASRCQNSLYLFTWIHWRGGFGGGIDLYMPVVFACYLLGEWLVHIETSTESLRWNEGTKEALLIRKTRDQ